MEKRRNQEYTIIDSLQVGRVEYVLGERSTHLDRYVVWECLNGTEYRHGNYTSDLGKAHEYLLERATKELQYQRDMGTLPPASIQTLDFENRNSEIVHFRPMWPTEQRYAFSQSTQIAGQCGNIGHLRGDFDSTGTAFCTTWTDCRSYLATPDFKTEFDAVINMLRHDKSMEVC